MPWPDDARTGGAARAESMPWPDDARTGASDGSERAILMRAEPPPRSRSVRALLVASIAAGAIALLVLWSQPPPPAPPAEVVAPRADPIATPHAGDPPPLPPPPPPPPPAPAAAESTAKPIRATAKSPRKPAPAAKIAPAKELAISEERRLLARAEAAPNDTEAFRALIAALRRKVSAVTDATERARLERLLEIAALSWDLTAAARVIDRLESR
jgi:hypothetical protein